MDGGITVVVCRGMAGVRKMWLWFEGDDEAVPGCGWAWVGTGVGC